MDRALVGHKNRWARVLIRLLLLAFSGVLAWWLTQRQTEFGELYAQAVTAKRPDLKLEYVNFERDIAQVAFQLIRVPEDGVTEARFVSELANHLKSVFCGFVSKGVFGDDLEVPVLNVGVRYDSGGHSGWVLSHAYSATSCLIQS